MFTKSNYDLAAGAGAVTLAVLAAGMLFWYPARAAEENQILFAYADVDALALTASASLDVSNEVDAKSLDANSTVSASSSSSAESDSSGEVSLAADEASKVHARSGRLFGFIPVSLTERAVVRADGSVKLSYPWYRFLVVLDAMSKPAAH